MRITDADFVEYEGFSGYANGEASLVQTLNELIYWLQNATIAADLFKDLMNDVILPTWDLTPL